MLKIEPDVMAVLEQATITDTSVDISVCGQLDRNAAGPYAKGWVDEHRITACRAEPD